MAKVLGDVPGDRARLLGRGGGNEGVNMREVVGDVPDLQPLVQLLLEEIVREGLAPQRRVGDARLGQRAVEVQHADEPRPLARPVGDSQDRRAMADQAGQHVVGVLPDGLGDDDRRLRVDLREDLQAFLLAGDEAVLAGGVEGMGALDLDVEPRERLRHLLSIAACAGQQVSLALWRKSPLAAIRTFLRGAISIPPVNAITGDGSLTCQLRDCMSRLIAAMILANAYTGFRRGELTRLSCGKE